MTDWRDTYLQLVKLKAKPPVHFEWDGYVTKDKIIELLGIVEENREALQRGSLIVTFNSLGGLGEVAVQAFELMVRRLEQEWGTTVWGIGKGQVASAAALMFLSCTKGARCLDEGANILFHAPKFMERGANGERVWRRQDATTEEEAIFLQQKLITRAEFLTERSNIPLDEAIALLEHGDYTPSPTEAVNVGIADMVGNYFQKSPIYIHKQTTEMAL